jgi:hypothetical protein
MSSVICTLCSYSTNLMFKTKLTYSCNENHVPDIKEDPVPNIFPDLMAERDVHCVPVFDGI